jgi:hypothetical protein
MCVCVYMLYFNPELLIEKNTAALYVDVGTLSNHVKYVSQLSLNISLGKLHFIPLKYLSIFTFASKVSSVILNPSNFQIVAI